MLNNSSFIYDPNTNHLLCHWNRWSVGGGVQQECAVDDGDTMHICMCTLTNSMTNRRRVTTEAATSFDRAAKIVCTMTVETL